MLEQRSASMSVRSFYDVLVIPRAEIALPSIRFYVRCAYMHTMAVLVGWLAYVSSLPL